VEKVACPLFSPSPYNFWEVSLISLISQTKKGEDKGAGGKIKRTVPFNPRRVKRDFSKNKMAHLPSEWVN